MQLQYYKSRIVIYNNIKTVFDRLYSQNDVWFRYILDILLPRLNLTLHYQI